MATQSNKARLPLRRLPSRLSQRMRRTRPGSVLIIVIALLVLMAIIGTAYIATARTDRYSAAQNAANTQVDMLVQGLLNIVEGQIAQDATASVNGVYAFHGTSYDGPADGTITPAIPSRFIADRQPTVLALASPATPAAGTNPVLWRFLTAPIANSLFEAPVSGLTPMGASTTGNVTYTTNKNLEPTYINVTQATGTISFPALYDPNAMPPTVFLAADTDGDGIADAALVRLPVGELSGVTYYGAVRVLDNAAGINTAVAFTLDAAPALGDFFPTSIDLKGLLNTNDVTGATPNFTTFNVSSRWGGQTTCSLAPIDDNLVKRTDFNFTSPNEAMWMQLGRRLADPGNYDTPAVSKYQSLSLTEQSQMARRFVLRDASVTLAANSPSVLEQDLSNSTFDPPAPTAVYSATDANATTNWFNANFYYDPTGTATTSSIRSLLVARNGVTNYAQTLSTVPTSSASNTYAGTNPYASHAFAVTTNYALGDWATFPGSSTAFVSLRANPGPTAIPPTGNASSPLYWEAVPWLTAPMKASVNTASFGQLWTSYWSMMHDPTTATKVPINTDTGQFRSSLRPGITRTTPPAWTPELQAQLRAALAAINTQDLRDVDADVTSRTINLTDSGGNSYTATVYGNERQPFITEVYANNAPGTPGGYIAIELYNPYATAISLLNWKLAAIPRPATPTATNLTPDATPFVATNTLFSVAATAPTIQPNGYVVLVSNATAPNPFVGTMGPTAAAGTPASLLVVCSDLATGAFNNELVILRPRSAAGTLTTGPVASDPNNVFDESAANTNALFDLVPVDSYDFTGLPQTTATATGEEWHYTRPNGTGAKPWQFVYPGKYDTSVTPSETVSRFVGTTITPAGTMTTLASMGAPDATGSYVSQSLELNCAGSAGPSGATYPFGGFARNGDILQVPFVGAYRITVSGSSTQILELNSISMDSAFVDDGYAGDDAAENIGRFCPIPITATGAGTSDDFNLGGSANWHYHWAESLFDHLTVQATNAAFLPETDPIKYAGTTLPQAVNLTASTKPPAQTFSKIVSGGGTTFTGDSNLRNSADYTGYLLIMRTGAASDQIGTINTYTVGSRSFTVTWSVGSAAPAVGDIFEIIGTPEESATTQGLININTAPWRVLATLPLGGSASQNASIAQAIVAYRDGTGLNGAGAAGPFKSIFELNNVPLFRDALGPVSTSTFTAAQGNLINDPVVGDFSATYLMLNRISNLITTRSDSYTVYVIVQGWRGIGTAQPQLVVQRRAAMIVDRSAVTPSNQTVLTTNVPVN